MSQKPLFLSHTSKSSPLVVSMPHTGSYIPDDITEKMTLTGKRAVDTDWHIHQLYQPVLDDIGCHWIAATHARYVVDLNRPADGAALYPGQDETGICPVTSFDRQPLYKDGADQQIDIAGRIKKYWYPYHSELSRLIGEAVHQYGFAILWDAHSIKNRVPRFFEGKLPDLNFGTVDNTSATIAIENSLKSVAGRHSEFSHIFNGRFKGGYITRQFGMPDKNIFAVQLEMSQALYMDQDYPFTFLEGKADQIRPVLEELLVKMMKWRP